MEYHVLFTDDVLKKLRKMDSYIRLFLLRWIRKNLEGCSNPRLLGKPLVGNHAGVWRYRVGDYRILAEIDDGKILIHVIDIGHRREIYR